MGRELTDRIASSFISLPEDEETERWIEHHRAPHGRVASFAHRVLRRWVSDYDADAILGMHPMHLLGTASWRRLIGKEHAGGTLLDIGAGNGAVTATLAPLFDRVVASETSRAMTRRLRKHVTRVLDFDLSRGPWPSDLAPSAVALLNVLDRSDRPRTLLARAVEHVSIGGLLIVSCPLPLRPHVDVGAVTLDPDEPLPIRAADFTSALRELFALIEQHGCRVARWARTSYRAQPSSGHAMHELDAAVLVALKVEDGSAK